MTMDDVTAKGDYFAMNCSDISIKNFRLIRNYSFDGVKNVEIHNTNMLSRDVFLNSENIKLYDSFISGEYLSRSKI